MELLKGDAHEPSDSSSSSSSSPSPSPSPAHLLWAQVIKTQHYHLQETWKKQQHQRDEGEKGEEERGGVCEDLSRDKQQDVEKVTTGEDYSNSSSRSNRGEVECHVVVLVEAEKSTQKQHTTSNMCYDRQDRAKRVDVTEEKDPEEDLREWAELLSAPAQKRRRVEYASAMYHLATQYWSPGGESSTSGGGRGDRRGGGGEAVKKMGAVRRRYDDRIELCLDCVKSYYLGVPRVPRWGSDTPQQHHQHRDTGTGSDSHVEEANADEAKDKEKEGEFPLLFSQAPLFIRPHSKAMRQYFFQTHQRMATAREVEHLLWGVPLPGARAPWRTSGDGEEQEEEEGGARCACPLPSWCCCCRAAGASTEGVDLEQRPRGGGGGSCWGTGEQQAREYVTYLKARWGLLKNTHHTSGSVGAPLPPLHVIDVGSCYGPFEHLCLPFGDDDDVADDPNRLVCPLEVLSVDLEPYQPVRHPQEEKEEVVGAANHNSTKTNNRNDGGHHHHHFYYDIPSVLAGDWLTTEIVTSEEPGGTITGEEYDGRWPPPPPPPSSLSSSSSSSLQLPSTVVLKGGRVQAELEVVPPISTTTTTEEEKGLTRYRYRLARLARGSFDVVIFCLLLSYLPSPLLRYQACLQAYLALKDGGLLVILSTRTQGRRRDPWVDEWVRAVEGIGFARVHLQVREKVVVLCFRKKGDGDGDDRPGDSDTSVREWKARMLRRREAATGLKITADSDI